MTEHTEHPGGSRRELVIVANRLPVSRVAGTDAEWERSPGGLVAALEPAVAQSSTTWVGWSGSADCPPPFVHGDLRLRPVPVDEAESDAFYGGFSNSTLWPLYHDAIFVPRFDGEWWRVYEAINRRFADVAAEVAAPGATVWIHDYQLQRVPQMLRDLRPDLRIGFFLHIPFPAQELFLRLPWRSELVEGILGADVVGFQTTVGAENFRAVTRRLLGARPVAQRLVHDGREVFIGTFPVGIDAMAIRRIAADPATVRRTLEIRAELGSPRTLLLGVDRLDYTKGIEVRLEAYRELLEEGRLDPHTTVLVQIAQPTRDEVPGYAETRMEVEKLVGRINGDFGGFGTTVVEYLHQGQPMTELAALYRAADIMLVTPFRDGMNLVAKEYVASRVDYGGTLILSEFTGAAHQLRRARLVNPFDVADVKAAIVEAVEQRDDPARRRRMMSLWRNVRAEDAAHWAATFLDRVDMAGIPAALLAALDRVRALRPLLVVVDYDGTLSEIVADPARAAPFPGAVAALDALAALSGVRVAVVTGRELGDLARVATFAEAVDVVGLHGAESADGVVEGLDDTAARRLGVLEAALAGLAGAVPGVRLERKRAGIALHHRDADEQALFERLNHLLAGPLAGDGLRIRQGKAVVELSVVDGDKGRAVRRLRDAAGAAAVVFVGDDVTDEDAFGVLHGGDVGIKVGVGPTRAGYRVGAPRDVVAVLRRLAVPPG